jgi:hypothetical protein
MGDGVLGVRPASCPPVMMQRGSSSSDESDDESEVEPDADVLKQYYTSCGRITRDHIDEGISAYLGVSY